MPVSPRQELLSIQKRLYKQNKKIIEHSIVIKEPGFDKYEERYKKAIKSYATVSSQQEMIQEILNSDIIYVGDYHTCNQSQRSFLRVLKSVVKKNKDIIIGLELVHKKHQEFLDKFLSERISEGTFLTKTGLKEHWIFDLWENFKPLFDFSKYHNISIYGIDAASFGSNLKKRDMASAKVLAKIIKENPKKKIFVFIGDLHIAPEHLPLDVENELKKFKIEKKSLILFENSENIYWKLAKKGLDDRVDVVKLKKGNYCRMHTPPLVCQQSYLNWLEHEEGEIDYYDAKSSFLDLVNRISKFLNIKLGKEKDNVEVFTSGDLSFLKKLRDSGQFTNQEISIIKQQILSSESYYIAKTKYVYLANLSLNHAAEEAAHFLKNLCSGIEKPRELIDAFFANVLHEALGFFGSKLINSKRKCYHEKNFKDLLGYLNKIDIPADREIEKKCASLLLEYLKYEKKGNPLKFEYVFFQDLEVFLYITHAIGYILGDKLYYGLISNNITRKNIKDLFLDPWPKKQDPYKVYMGLVKKLKGVKVPRRM